ncbi:MAG: sigma-70 family RNA polymerase sigma factor [Nitriliruptorales bacterium]|nr:sigma-70 family RNA polymerase sigma factor [Nitriliruptorales bacterium]
MIGDCVRVSAARAVAGGVTRLGTGSSESMEIELVGALYEEFGPALYRFACRLLGDPDRAQRAVHDVLLRAWRQADRLKESAQPEQGWLLDVARDVMADHWRAAQSQSRTGDLAAAGKTLPADGLVDRLVQEWQVEASFSELSPLQRQILISLADQDRSVSEVARELDLPAGKVWSRTHYALRTLRAALERRGVTR